VNQFIDQSEQLLYMVAERKTRASFVRIGDLMMSTYKHIEELYTRKELVTGVPTGFTDLDRITAGCSLRSDRGRGRPSMGKTSFC